MTLGEMGGGSARAPGVVVSRRIEDQDAGLTVTYRIRATEAGEILVTDRLKGVDPNDFGFHPDHEPAEWAMQDETVVFKFAIEDGLETEVVFGLATDSPEDLLVREPTVERIDDGRAPSDENRSTTDRAGVLRSFGALAGIDRFMTGGEESSGAETAAALEDRLTGLEDRIETLEEAGPTEPIRRLPDRVDELADRVERQAETIETLRDRTATVEELATLPDRIAEIEDELAALRADQEGLADTVAELDAAAREGGPAVDDLSDRMDSIASTLHDLQSGQRDLESRVSALAANLDEFEEFRRTLSSAFEDDSR